MSYERDTSEDLVWNSNTNSYEPASTPATSGYLTDGNGNLLMFNGEAVYVSGDTPTPAEKITYAIESVDDVYSCEVFTLDNSTQYYDFTVTGLCLAMGTRKCSIAYITLYDSESGNTYDVVPTIDEYIAEVGSIILFGSLYHNNMGCICTCDIRALCLVGLGEGDLVDLQELIKEEYNPQ